MTALVLLHGLGGCSTDWSDAEPHVRSHASSIVAPDAPGHGGRPFDGHLGFPEMADEVIAELDRRGVERAVLAGVSMGAATAVTVAARAPARVAGLVLLAPAWWRERAPANLRRLQKIGSIIERHGLRTAWEVVAAVPPVSWYDAETQEPWRRRFLAADASGLAAAMRQLPRRLPDWPTERSSWRAAVRVVTWRDDPIHPVEVGTGVAGELGCDIEVWARPRSRHREVELVADLVASVLSLVSAIDATPKEEEHATECTVSESASGSGCTSRTSPSGDA